MLDPRDITTAAVEQPRQESSTSPKPEAAIPKVYHASQVSLLIGFHLEVLQLSLRQPSSPFRSGPPSPALAINVCRDGCQH